MVTWLNRGAAGGSTEAPAVLAWHRQPGIWVLAALLVIVLSVTTTLTLARRMDPSLALMAALPVAGLGGWLLLTQRAWLLALLLLVRTPLDPVFAAMSGGGLGPGAIVNALVLVLGALAVLAAPRRFANIHVAVWLPFVGLLALAAWASEDRPQAVRLLLTYLSCFVMFMLPSLVMRTRADVRRWLIVLALASLVPTLAGLWDLAGGGVRYEAAQEQALENPDWAGEIDLGGEGLRVMGAYAHPNIYAFYIVTVLATLLLLLRMNARRWPLALRTVGWGYLLLQLAMLLATRTRSAWAAAALLFVAYAAFVDRRALKFVAMSALALPFIPAVRDRMLDLFGAGQRATDAIDSFQWRQALWDSAWPWIQERWATGWGLDTFNRLSTVFFPFESVRGFDAHNVYVQLAFEGGAFTAGAYALVFLGLLAVAVTAPRAHRTPAAILGALAAGYMLGSYSDNMHRYLVANWYWFFLMGVLCASVHGSLLSQPGGTRPRLYRLRAARSDELPTLPIRERA
jgi:hypothetical protein